MMFAQRVRPDELIDLLAAESYDPVLMKYCGYTKTSPKLEDFITDKARLGVTGTIANAYVTEGTAAAIPYLTTKQVDGLYAHLDGCKYITADADHEWSNCRVPDGAIVLNKSGNVGAAAIVACAPYAYVNTVSDLINIRPRRLGTAGGGRGIDNGYLIVFLNSPYGQSQLQRLSGGAVFDHVSLFAVPELRIYEPNPLAQRYIGDKVRQAERLRERARLLDSLSFAAFEPLTQSLPSPQRAFRVPSSEVEAYRLNPNHFDPVVRAAIHTAKAIARLHPLSDLVVDGDIAGGATPLGAQYLTDGIFFARVQNVKPLRLDRSDAAFISADQDREIVRSRCRMDDVVLSITGYPGTASVVLDEDLPLNINQHSVRFAVRSEFGAGYVAAAINSRFGQLQVDRLAVGGTRDALDYTSVRSLLIPEFSIETREAINTQVRIANQCVRAAQRVVALAKLLVEHLIDGRLAEADLVAAQKALESGDRSADREILKSLRQSDAPDAKPLIADVDALYSLLDSSEGQDP
jgi:type I restriction enzyme S subunit